jgi:hypothetical protein
MDAIMEGGMPASVMVLDAKCRQAVAAITELGDLMASQHFTARHLQVQDELALKAAYRRVRIMLGDE